MNRCTFLLVLVVGLLMLLLGVLPANAKVAIDFDPNLDFSKYKTFAYIGGQEQLQRLQLNPDQFNNQIHGAVVRELTAKGLREVQLEGNPDLVVRYWVETKSDAGVGYGASWATYGTYWTGHWTMQYISMHTHTTNEGTLGIELIDAKMRTLAWRMFATEKIYHTNPTKIWKLRMTASRKLSKAINRPQKPSKRRKYNGVKKTPRRNRRNLSLAAFGP